MTNKFFLKITLLLVINCVAQFANAHSTPIALLDINERQQGIYNIDWTYSSPKDDKPPTAVYPEHCEYQHPILNCGEKGLIGEFSLLELGEKYSAAVVQIHPMKGESRAYTLTGANPKMTLTASGKMPIKQVMSSYIPLGFEHIMLGIDHLLFVLGLMLIVSGNWMLIKTISAFTIAHSITLAAVTLGWIGISEASVNAAIALSIVIMAVEVIRYKHGEHCLSAKYPWAIAFGFGLLHGFGFAGALTDIGLPPENLPAALLFFNIGVEIGQICFVFIVLALTYSHRQLSAELPKWAEKVGIYAMGSIASFWFIARIHILFTAST